MSAKKLIRMLLMASLMLGAVIAGPFATTVNGDGRPPVIMKTR